MYIYIYIYIYTYIYSWCLGSLVWGTSSSLARIENIVLTSDKLTRGTSLIRNSPPP